MEFLAFLNCFGTHLVVTDTKVIMNNTAKGTGEEAGTMMEAGVLRKMQGKE